jgi:endonuclease-3
MNNKPLSLRHVLEKLEAFYGPPEPPKVIDPFQMILWENVVYLSDDIKREIAFRVLRERVGLEPDRILQAPIKVLHEIGRYGIMPELSANKLRHAAQVAINEFGGNLAGLQKMSLKKARVALAKFPGISEMGAERVLLFSHTISVPALDSNGTRVLLRLGFGKEKKDPAATYRSVQEALGADDSFDSRIKTFLLTQQHGRRLCLISSPACEQCPLSAKCPYYRELSKSRRAKR